MLTAEENIIFGLLQSKRGVISEPGRLDGKETRKEKYNRYYRQFYKEVTQSGASRMIEKNLQRKL